MAQRAESDWEDVVAGREPLLRALRSVFRWIPSSPRCKLCLAPFAGAGGVVMRLIGKSPWERNPNVCGQCVRSLRKLGAGGVEAELTLVFADVRGSTALAERMAPRDYAALIQRFFRAAGEVFARGDAILDQLVGDEAIGLFLPGYAGPDHVFRAVESAWRLLEATGHGADAPPWLPLGAGVHSGVAYVGSVASGASGAALVDFTATGDAVNVCARLASAAGPGEILVSEATAQQAGLERAELEVRELHLKGKSTATRAVVLRGPPARRTGAEAARP